MVVQYARCATVCSRGCMEYRKLRARDVSIRKKIDVTKLEPRSFSTSFRNPDIRYVARNQHLKPLSFLLVDDVSASCKLLDILLRELGARGERIHKAQSLVEAERILHRNHIDIVFSDLHLQETSGLRLLDTLRANPEMADVPFILVTNTPDKCCLDEAVRKGVASVLLKPISIAAVAEGLAPIVA